MVSKRSWRKIGRYGPLGTHKTLILSKENGDTSVNFADSERDEHVWLEREVDGCLFTAACWSRPTLGLSGTSVYKDAQAKKNGFEPASLKGSWASDSGR